MQKNNDGKTRNTINCIVACFHKGKKTVDLNKIKIMLYIL